jgi:hypothetical protein
MFRASPTSGPVEIISDRGADACFAISSHDRNAALSVVAAWQTMALSPLANGTT